MLGPNTVQSALVEQNGMQRKPASVCRHWFAVPHSAVLAHGFEQ
jgi:hypothetical protein